jgi:hypothetical protein
LSSADAHLEAGDLAEPAVLTCFIDPAWRLDAPALRSAISRSAATRGAGDRPSASSVGLSRRLWASRRRLARPPRDPFHHLGDHRAVQRRLDAGDEIDHDADRVGEHLRGHHGGHQSPARAGDAGPLSLDPPNKQR